MPDRILEVQQQLIEIRQLGLGRDGLVDDAELEGADRGLAVDRVLLVLHGQLAPLLEILHDLPQIDVHALGALEAQVQPDAEDAVRAVGLELIVHGVRLVEHMDGDKPVGLRALGVLVEDRIEDIAVHELRVRLVVEVDQVVREQGELRVLMQRDKARHMLADAQARAVLALELCPSVPDHHQREQHQREQHRDIAAMGKLAEARDKEDRLDPAESGEHRPGERRLPPQPPQIDRKQQRRHQHRDRDGEAVGRLHPRTGTEIQHHQRAADPEHRVDRADVELALGVRGVADLQVRQQVQQDRLRHQGVGAGDQRLGGDDRGRRAEQDRKGPQQRRQHQEEGVEVLHDPERRIAPALQNPGPLAEVVEDQAELDEGPAEIDVLPPDMAHVRVERFRAGGGEEDAAEDHKAELVVFAQQDLNRVDRVEGLENQGQVQDVQQAREAEEAEPEQHHRPEGLADTAGALVLYRKKHGDDRERNEYDLPLSRAEKAVHARDRAQALHRGRDRDGGGQHPVGEQGRAAEHGRQDPPLAEVLHQRVEREDTALTVVVRLHGDQHIFDGGEQRDRPDHEGQRADDEALIHVLQAAVALQDRLHHVHRGGPDVAVDDPDGHQKQAKAKALPFFHASILPSRPHGPCDSRRRCGSGYRPGLPARFRAFAAASPYRRAACRCCSPSCCPRCSG